MTDFINAILMFLGLKQRPLPPAPVPEPEPSPIVVPPPLQPTILSAVITRYEPDDGTETIGELNAVNGQETFKCETLELPWKNNETNASCVPKGTYLCTLKPFHNVMRYYLSPTGPRTGIAMHEGDFYTNTLGCILLGIHPSDINGDGQIDVTNSLPTTQNFIKFFGGQPFTLTIR